MLDLFLPPTIDFCVFWLVLTLMLMLARRPGQVRRVVWGGMIAFTPWLAFKNWAYVVGKSPNHTIGAALFCLAASVFLAFLLLWRPEWEERFERVVNVASTIFLLMALSGVLLLCETVWFGWQARSLNAVATPHNPRGGPRSGGRPRVLWIVFDELSYRQVYEQRFPGLQLPAFDDLAAQATVFSHTVPAGTLTDRVLPSLMTGTPVDAMRSSADGSQLSLRNPSTGVSQLFDERGTVFDDARRLGYGTAVAGWYNPYCRILPEVLDRCSWTFSAPTENLTFPRLNLRANLMAPLLQEVGGGWGHRVVSVFHQVPELRRLNAEQHIFDYETLVAATDQVLDDRSAGFVLIHIPVPHPGGIYDRRADRLVTEHSTYIDNLALTDKFLGHIRSKLEESDEWNSSAIVVMGDHSWRLGLFETEVPELPEEERVASQGGRFDDRPAYIVKLPNQRAGTRIDAPFAALSTRRLLDALLSKRIQTAEDLAAWAKGN